MWKQWYKVFLANPEMSELHVYRTGWDRLLALDVPAFLVFRKEDGKRVKINKHWVIKIELL